MKKKAGFSLIEIMFTLVGLTLLLIPLYSIFGHGSQGTMQNRNEILAQQHATNLLSYLYLFPYEHSFLEPGNEKPFNELNLKMDTEKLSMNQEEMFSRTLSVREFKPESWPLSYKVITVSVLWEEFGKVRRELKVCGLIFK